MNEPDEVNAGQSVPPVAAGTEAVAARPLTAASFARAFGERCPNCKVEVDRNGVRTANGPAGEAGRDVMQIVCPECRAGLELGLVWQEPPAPTPATEGEEASRAAALAAFLSTGDRKCPQCSYDLRGLRHGRCPECKSSLRLVIQLRPPQSWVNMAAWIGGLLSASIPPGLHVILFGRVMFGLSGGTYKAETLRVWLAMLLLIAVWFLVLAGRNVFRRLPPMGAVLLAANCVLLVPAYLLVLHIVERYLLPGLWQS